MHWKHLTYYVYMYCNTQGSSDADTVSNQSECTKHEDNHEGEETESGGDTSTDGDSEVSTDSDSTTSERQDDNGVTVDKHKDEKLPRPTTTRKQKQASATRTLSEKQPRQASKLKLPDSPPLAKARTKENVTDTPSVVAGHAQGMETKSQERTEKVNEKSQAQSTSTAKPLLAPKPTLNVTGDSKDKHSSPPTQLKRSTKSTSVSSASAGSAVASQQKHFRNRTSSVENGDSKSKRESTAAMNSSVSSQLRPKVHSFSAKTRVPSSPQRKQRTSTNAGASGWTRKDEERADDSDPEFQMLCQLQQQAAANDYYTLLGVEAGPPLM